MNLSTDSPAVDVARAHVKAWSNHDFEAAKDALAPDVKVTVTTTKPVMPDTNTTGVDDYMTGLVHFAQTVVPGSMREVASVGDDHNALLMVTVGADFGAGQITLPAARLYLVDDDHKIAVEQVVFLIPD
jgi:hypothetical protein